MQPDHARFARWLAAAIFLHALLLLIPGRQLFSPTAAMQSLRIALSGEWRSPPQSRTAHGDPGERAIEAERRTPHTPAGARSAPTVAPSPEPPAAPPRAVERAHAAGPPVTAAGLLDDAQRRAWNLPEPSDPPRPGVFRPAHSNPWPASAAASAGRSGADLPSGTGVIDQWLAADGSRNVMLRAPNGQLLCGRAEAWNPMSPLIEPVIMYRACGDGRRSFEMPPRVLLR